MQLSWFRRDERVVVYKAVVARPRIGRDNNETKDFGGMMTPASSPAIGTSPMREPKISKPRGLVLLILRLAPVFYVSESDRETKHPNLQETRVAQKFPPRAGDSGGDVRHQPQRPRRCRRYLNSRPHYGNAGNAGNAGIMDDGPLSRKILSSLCQPFTPIPRKGGRSCRRMATFLT
jgi:hypothetical protein